MNRQETSEAFSGLLKLAKASIETYGKYRKAEATGTTGDELQKLEENAKTSRAAFNSQQAAVIGDQNTEEGRVRNRDWGFYAQKSFVMGLVNGNIFRARYVDPRFAGSLGATAEAYVAGHKALGWTIQHGVNPRSVQTLEDALSKALEKSRQDLDTEKVQRLQAAVSNLRRSAWRLLEQKVEQQKSAPINKIGDAPGAEQLSEPQSAIAEQPAPQQGRPRSQRKSR